MNLAFSQLPLGMPRRRGSFHLTFDRLPRSKGVVGVCCIRFSFKSAGCSNSQAPRLGRQGERLFHQGKGKNYGRSGSKEGSAGCIVAHADGGCRRCRQRL
jgi:hypothetical protein